MFETGDHLCPNPNPKPRLNHESSIMEKIYQKCVMFEADDSSLLWYP